MTSQVPSYHGFRFPPESISHAIGLYHRFCLSFRDVEDLLAQRGIRVTYETFRQWCSAVVQGVVQNLFRVGRHLLQSVHHRVLRTRAFVEWDAVTWPLLNERGWSTSRGENGLSAPS